MSTAANDNGRFTSPETVTTDSDPIDDKAEEQAKSIDIEKLMEVWNVSTPMTSTEFDAADFKVDYIIDDILPAMQLCGVAGPAKGMKTTTTVDLALSIGCERMFLDRFWVPQAKRVLVCSAESGEGTLQETARRIANAKGFSLADAGENVCWEFWVPLAKNVEQMSILKHFLKKHRPEVIIIDPLYQTLDGDDQASVSKNGQQIMDLARVCQDHDCTPVMVDHVKRSSENAKNYLPLELTDVTGAGKAEAFRSWLLLGRRRKFDPENPLHRMWLTVGGSAGHCGSYAIDINESRDASGDRSYLLETMFASEAIDADMANHEREKANQQEQRDAEKLRLAVSKFRSALPAGVIWSKSQVRDATNLKPAVMGSAIAHLLSTQELETRRHKNPTGPWFDGFCWAGSVATETDEQGTES